MYKYCCAFFALVPLSMFYSSVLAAEILETRFGSVLANENEEILVNGNMIQRANKESDNTYQMIMWVQFIGPFKTEKKDYVVINYRINGLYCREQYRVLELASNVKPILSKLLAGCDELSDIKLQDDGLLLEFRPSVVCDGDTKCTPEDTKPSYTKWHNGEFSETSNKPD